MSSSNASFPIVIVILPTARERSITVSLPDGGLHLISPRTGQSQDRWRRHARSAAVLLGGQLQWTVRSTVSPQPGVLVRPRGHHRHLLRGPAHFTPHQGWRRFILRTQLTGTTRPKEI